MGLLLPACSRVLVTECVLAKGSPSNVPAWPARGPAAPCDVAKGLHAKTLNIQRQ